MEEDRQKISGHMLDEKLKKYSGEHRKKSLTFSVGKIDGYQDELEKIFTLSWGNLSVPKGSF